MNVAFTRADLNTWASFSGDYNPIHFNEDAVKNYGLDGVVVHGMLAMLSLKSRVPRENWRGPWVEWRGMLKRAMPLSSSYTISDKAGETAAAAKFSLADSASGTKCIIGTWSEVEPDLATLPREPQFTIANVDEKLAAFRASYPKSTGLWVFLDALVFSVYLSEHSKTMFAADLLEYLGVEPRSEGESPNFMAMHTYHTVTSSVAMMQRELPEKAPKVEYAVMRKERIVTGEAVYGLIDIPIWVDGTLEIVVEMGLMAKKL